MNKQTLFIGGAIIIFVIAGFVLMGNSNSNSDEGEKTASKQQAEKMAPVNEMVMEPPKQMEQAVEDKQMMKSNTIVDKAIELEMTTLVEAVKAAGLVETLSSEGPFTVFVPTQAAFDAIAPTLEQIMAAPDAAEQLADILTYHVVAGKVPASDVISLSSAATVQGSDVAIKVQGSTVMVNDANVVQTDVMVDNGIIHVIDKVLIPHSN